MILFFIKEKKLYMFRIQTDMYEPYFFADVFLTITMQVTLKFLPGN